MRPIIGILAEVDDELVCKVQNPYISAIERSGGIPVLLPYVESNNTIKDFVQMCDGFLFTGGADIDPQRYGESRKDTCGAIQYKRDEFEFNVLEEVLKTSKPILAICRGAQLVNVALGGTLYQDIPSELCVSISHRQSEPRFSPSHQVNVFTDTPLGDLMGKACITANSFHHQAVKTLGKELAVMATADDGIMEAFYIKEKQYIRAYQWHPERLYDIDCDNQEIFNDFIRSC